nr:hypothetical protein [Calliblepharis sp.]
MNLFIGTCKIINNPRLYQSNKTIFLKMTVSLFNKKKNIYLHPITVQAKGKIGIRIFDIYKKADFIMIEGSIKKKIKKNI